MKIRSIVSSSLGNILEWYDFGLFAVFSPLFGELFFPAQDPHAGLIATFSVFAVGFFCRPLGSLLFGYLGDRQGRARTLRLSVLMISLPTLILGFIPSYQQIGLWAPFLLVLIRIWQGISLGGEYSGNIIYLAETAPRHLRATLTSFASTGANLGIILATSAGTACLYFFPETVFKSWGWRLPYLFGGVLSLFVYLTRLKLDETQVFEYLKSKKLLAVNPIETAFAKNIPQMLRTLGLVCMGSTYYYFCFVYIPVFLAKSLQLPTYVVSGLMTFLLLLMLLLVPLSGLLCDRVGRRKMLLFNAALIMFIVVPGYYFLQNYALCIGLVMLIFAIASSLEQATTSIAVVENYPAVARYTGLSFSYNLANGLLGGTVPLVSAWLAGGTRYPLAPAFYITACAVVTWLTVYFFVPETAHSSLHREAT